MPFVLSICTGAIEEIILPLIEETSSFFTKYIRDREMILSNFDYFWK